jgi:hypothetical protein
MIFERGYFSNKSVQESVITDTYRATRLFSKAKAYSYNTTVFLSHKHDDLVDLRGVMGMLEELDAKIYIDSMDNKMPDQTTGETAQRIKEVIQYCDKFILLATAAAIESFWCNWELGIGDVHKYMQHIAILPIKEKGQYDWNYKGNEYLQIYPRIDYEDGTNSYRNSQGLIPRGYYISNPKDKNGIRYITPLKEWLRK